MVMATTARVECTLKGDEWTVIFTGPKDKSTTFKLGQEFEDETPDGRKVKVSGRKSIKVPMISLIAIKFSTFLRFWWM